MKQNSNPVAQNRKRVAWENPFKCVERPCQFQRFCHAKSEEINSYFIHQNYAPIEFVIYNQKQISNRVAYNLKRVTQENPLKWIERPCQFKRIFREKSEEIKLYLVHKNYALICFVIYNHEIE